MKEIRVGLIGLGFIGKVHTLAYRALPLCYPQTVVSPVLAAVLRSDLSRDPQAARTAGFEFATASLEEFLAQPLDLVDVCTPNFLHLGQVSAALEKGIPVYCEKPLGNTLAEARQLAVTAENIGVPTHTAFINRYYPAVRQMKAIIASGAIGEVRTFRAQKFHSSYMDPQRAMSWRLRMAESGGGVMMDLGVHLVDLARYLVGEVAGVKAEMRTFISERPTAPGSAQMEKVDVDDWALCSLQMANGAMGVIETTRLAAGANESTSFEVYGSKGSALFSDRDPNFAQFYDLKQKRWLQGPLDFQITEDERPIQNLWPASKFSQGDMTNRHMASIYDFLLNIAEKKPSSLDFRTAAAAQEIVEASYLSAARHGQWIALPLP
jgi:predicted dehydrogenase